jgi:hypothetical protein
VSRWKSPKREDILKGSVADSEEAGPNMLVESEPLDDNSGLFPRRVYILNLRNTRPIRSALNIIETARTIQRSTPISGSLQPRRDVRQRWLTHEGWASGSVLLRERKPFRK